MHFQVIKDEYFNKLIQDLKEKVPEFQSVFDEDDGVYPILGEFSRFVIENIDDKKLSGQAFEFINHAVQVGGSETEDAIVLQIFHPIYDDKLLVAKAQKFLSSKVSEVFEKFKNRYDTDSRS
ncbi:MAG: hypothetical protein AAGC64_13975 [Bacteroidota bacterium]